MPHLLKRRCFAFCAVSVALAGMFGCAPSINYAVKSVPEEAALQFTRITNDQDSVLGPAVYWKGKSWSYDVRNRISLSPNGIKLAYMGKKTGTPGIVVRMLDGSFQSFGKPEFDEAIDPCIAPDGMKIAFARRVHGSWNIYETTLDSNPTVRRITHDAYYNVFPQYSPDRKQLLFNHVELQPGHDKGGVVPSPRLWGADLQTSLVTDYGAGSTPSFSPNGSKVVIVRVNDSTHTTELWTVDLATGAQSLLFGHPGQGAADPAVSPKGDAVAFVGMTEGKDLPTNLDIYTVNMDGTNLQRRTFFPGQDICPRWSGDGASLFFLSQRGGEEGAWNVWKMDLAANQTAPAPATPEPKTAPADSAKPVLKAPPPQAASNPEGQKAAAGADSSKISSSPKAPDTATQGGK